MNGQTMMIVSGRIVFDGLGRSVEQHYPVVEPLGQAVSCPHCPRANFEQ